jgi:hypothetical protein
MSKPEDIPQDIWDEAYRWAEDGGTIYRNIARAILNERNNAAKIASDLAGNNQQIRLHMGELSAQELRSVKAILNFISQAIRNGGK